ncbi:putative leucine-rich repeat domain superfamily [Helianthus annuus]|nr:putative leucine-rich repeat domain superfamily [Helianthus annuus]
MVIKLHQLTVLKLHNCVFQPPAMFKGFSWLIRLDFENVGINADVLLRLISNCPLLAAFTLIGDEKHLKGCWNSDYVELVEDLPHIEFLRMSSYPIQCFATSLAPQKLPALLVRLKYLYLSGLCFKKENALRSALLCITSSPNVERIIMEMHHNPTEPVSQTAMNFFELQDYAYVIFDYLRKITITNFTNMKPLMNFVKLILTNSPMLKLIFIVIDERVAVDDEVEMLKELIQYPRASARAQIIFERP